MHLTQAVSVYLREGGGGSLVWNNHITRKESPRKGHIKDT